jgi:hypothetical protein
MTLTGDGYIMTHFICHIVLVYCTHMFGYYTLQLDGRFVRTVKFRSTHRREFV